MNTASLNFLDMDAETLLAIQPDNARPLLDDDFLVQENFQKLKDRWHPNSSDDPRAAEVFVHIFTLRKHLQKTAGTLIPVREFVIADGSVQQIQPLAVHGSESGELLVLENCFCQHFVPASCQLAHAMAQTLNGIHFSDARTKQEMGRFLPHLSQRIELRDGGCLLILPRPSDSVPLASMRDYLKRTHTTLNEKELAWIGSGLMNISVWLDRSRLMHGGIDDVAVWVDLTTQDVHLHGSWEYATPCGAKPPVLPACTRQLLNDLTDPSNIARSDIDRLSIRRLLRDLLGNPEDAALLDGSLIPEPFGHWLISSPAITAIKDFSAWRAAIKQSWGTERFHESPLHGGDVLNGRSS